MIKTPHRNNRQFYNDYIFETPSYVATNSTYGGCSLQMTLSEWVRFEKKTLGNCKVAVLYLVDLEGALLQSLILIISVNIVFLLVDRLE